MNIEIVIHGDPIAKKRPRFARRGKFVTTYNDQETEEGKFIAQVLHQIPEHTVVDIPLKLEIIFCKFRPQGHYGTGRNAGTLKKSAPIWPTTKPDVDNYIKFVFDCLNGIVWKDDACVVMVKAKKIYSVLPCTIINIMSA